MYWLFCCDTSRVPVPSHLSPEGSPKLVPCWILAREVGSVAVTPGHRVLPLVLPVHSCCSSSSQAFFSEHPRQRSAGTFCLWPLWCCLYVFHACLLTLAVLGHSFPWEGLCPPWALPESSAPTGGLKHHLRVQPSAGLGVVVRAGG